MGRLAGMGGRPEQAGQVLTGSAHDPHIRCRGPVELVMDILRHGAEVEVVGPEALRAEVTETLRRALAQYGA